MHLLSVGTAGLGLVWGWLLGLAAGRTRRSFLNILVLTFAALLPGGLVYLVSDSVRAVLCLAVSAFSLWVHLACLDRLRSRASSKGEFSHSDD